MNLIKDINNKLKETNDFVLVDCPAGIEQGFQTAIAGASEAIVVTLFSTTTTFSAAIAEPDIINTAIAANKNFFILFKI